MKKIMIFILCGFYMLNSMTIKSQTLEIKGFVVDSLTQDKIEFANVLLLNNDSSFYAGITTDSLGHFIFHVKERKPHLLKISYMGYNNKIFPVKVDQFVKAELSQSEMYLEEVVIKGKFDVIKNNTANFIFRVTDNMKENAYLTTHILEKIPNVYVDFNNRIYVKGDGDVLILQNGIELPSNTLVNQISPQTIEKVEISRIIPTKYLNKGVSSVVNIITKRVNKINLRVHSNLSPNKLYDADMNFNIDREKHSFYTYYKLYYRDFIEEKTINDNTDNVYSTCYLQTRPRKEFDNEFFYGYSYNLNPKISIGIDGYLSLYNEKFQTRNNVNENYVNFSNSKIDFTIQNYSSFLQFKDSINSLNIRLNYNIKKVSNEMLYFENSDDNSIDDNYSLSSEVDYSLNLHETLKLNMGVNYNHINNKTRYNYSSQISDSRFSENDFGGYFDFNKDFNNFSVLLGANMFYSNRYFRDNLSVKSTYILPKFSVVYNINDYHSMMLNFYSAQNLPSIWQLMGTPINITPNYIMMGNPYLKPENTITSSFEYDYSKGSAYFSLVVFYNKTKNKTVDVYANIGNDKVMSSKMNLNKCNDIGFSTSYSNSIFDWWTIRMNFDIFNKNIPENNYYKNNLVSFGASLTNAFNYNKKWALAMRYEYNGRRLVYNGYFKPYNNSLMQLRYNVNKKIGLSLIWIQPIDIYKSESMVYYDHSGLYANNIDQIKISTILFSFTYNILNHQKKNNIKIYNNEDKKY